MRHRRRLLLALAGLGISCAAIFLLTRIVDLEETARILGAADPRPIVIVLAVVALQVLLRSTRWRYLLPRRPDGERPSLPRLVAALLVGYLGNVVLPARLGEPIRAYVVARREQVDFVKALGSVVLERVLDLATLAVILFVAATLAGAPPWILRGTGIVAMVGFLAAAFLVFAGIARSVRVVERLVGRGGHRARRAAAALERFAEGAGGQPRTAIGLAIGISAACWFLDGTTFWLVAQAIHVDLSWASALLVAGIAVLGTALPSAPGYIGTFELAAVAAAAAVGLAHESSLAIAIVAHALTILPLALAGSVSVAGMSLTLRGAVAEVGRSRR